MILQEVKWIKNNSRRICPSLRQKTLNWYRPVRFVPCFLQKYFKLFKQNFNKLPVIIQTQPGMSKQLLATKTGCTIKNELPLINAFSTQVTASKLQELIESESVQKAWYDAEVKAILDIASPAVASPPLWNEEITGEDVVVAVVDTGIYPHADLGERIIAFKDFVANRTTPYDDNGHGTHVAGDIAADGSLSDFRYQAPAPKAKLVGIKVLDRLGSGTLSSVIAGIQWCIDKKDELGIRVINMSLGSTATQSYQNDPVCQAVEQAWESGIVVCVAAGNSGPEPRTIGSPAIDPLVITVGALDDMNTVENNDDIVASYSSRGPTIDGLVKPDVVAPGTNIVSLRSPNSFLDKQNKQARVEKNYFSLSGTSMATPVCASVVAQMLQADNTLQPDEVKIKLMSTASSLGLGPNIQGAGLINAKKAAAVTNVTVS